MLNRTCKLENHVKYVDRKIVFNLLKIYFYRKIIYKNAKISA